MRRTRTEDLGIVFLDRFADGWVFDVCEEFRPNLDILMTKRVDRKRSMQKEIELGRKLEQGEKIYKIVWTRRVPPALSFAEGHVFYDPHGVRTMPWSEALKIVRRRVQIIDAMPDPDALMIPHLLGEEAEAPATDAKAEKKGWVLFEVVQYLEGECTGRTKIKASQQEFAAFLKTGDTPSASTEDAGAAENLGPTELVR